MSSLLFFLPTIDDHAECFKEFKILLESCALTISDGDKREENKIIEDWGVKYACIKVHYNACRVVFINLESC